MKIANAFGIRINVFMDFDMETISDALSLQLKMDEQPDMNFEAEKDKYGKMFRSCYAKQSIFTDSKIVKKGVRGISVKIYPENTP